MTKTNANTYRHKERDPGTPLNDAYLKSLKPEASLYREADMLGLSIEVATTGTLAWRFRYRFAGKAQMIGFGVYPAVSLAEARERRDAARKLLKDKIDPLAQRRAAVEAARAKAEAEAEAAKAQAEHDARGRFSQVAAEWLAFKAKGWADETYRKAKFVLACYLTPALGEHDIATLASKDAAAPLVALAETAPNLARKARQYIGGIVRYAQRQGLRNADLGLLLDETIPKFEKGHIPAATAPDALAEVMRAVHAYPTPVVRAALLMSLYTAQRPGVIASMQWGEVQSDEWRIPAGKMKTRRAHIVPMPRQCLTLLDEMKGHASSREYVFPALARQSTPHLSRDALSLALRKMGLAGKHATHGARAALRTVARERLGVDIDVLEAQLAHAKKGEVATAYDRTSFTDERVRVMAKWCDYLDNLRDGGASVTPIKRKRA
jgi:integrase